MEEAKIELIFKDINKLSDIKLRRVTNFCKERVDELLLAYKKQRLKQAPKILERKMRYKNPKFLNLKQLMENDFEEVWILF